MKKHRFFYLGFMTRYREKQAKKTYSRGGRGRILFAFSGWCEKRLRLFNVFFALNPSFKSPCSVLGPTEVQYTLQATLYFVHNLAWAATLGAYLESSPYWNDTFELMTSVEYANGGPDVRITVLSLLADILLIFWPDHCRVFKRLGELNCC